MDLNQVTLPTTNMDRSIAFYQNLGFNLIVHTRPGYARFECSSGASTFSLHQVDEVADGMGIVVYFENESLDELVEQLIRKGVEFDNLPIDQPWLWREARLKDPDGNQLILYYAGENRKNPPWKIKK